MDQAVTTEAPAIGEPWQGGIYAGVTVHDNQPMHLIELPDEFTGTWAKAGAWAKKQGGELPSRVDALILFQNRRDAFERAWYWTSEQYAGDAGYAWYQAFSSGSQYDDHKSLELRARAVRRVPLR